MKIPILMYHRVGEPRSESRYTISPERFARHMNKLRDLGYSTVDLSAIADAVESKRGLTERSIAITFDDGFLDTYENAAGLLARLGYSATFFLVSGLMGGSSEWMRTEGQEAAPLMKWRDAKHLMDAGFTIGSHTRTHADLTTLTEAEIQTEIDGSKRELEDHLGVPVQFFAYPYGFMNDLAVDVVRRAGFRAACSTRSGFNTGGTDYYALRRIEVRGTDATATLMRSVQFGENSMSAFKLVRYYSQRALSRLSRARAR